MRSALILLIRGYKELKSVAMAAIFVYVGYADLEGLNMAAQTFSCGVSAGGCQPRLCLGHPGGGAVDHLLMLLKPCLNLTRNTIRKP